MSLFLSTEHEVDFIARSNCNECLLENTCTPLFCWDLVMRDVLVYLNENKGGYHF